MSTEEPAAATPSVLHMAPTQLPDGSELVLRVKGLLRRLQSSEPAETVIRFGELVIDVPKHTATISGKEIELTATDVAKRLLEEGFHEAMQDRLQLRETHVRIHQQAFDLVEHRRVRRI